MQAIRLYEKIRVTVCMFLLGANITIFSFAIDINDTRITDYMKRRELSIGDNEAFRRFAMLYAPPDKLLDKIITHELDFYIQNRTPDVTLYTIEDYEKRLYVKKRDFLRLIYGARIQKYIRQQKLTHVAVVQEYVVFAGNRWYIIGEEIPAERTPPPGTVASLDSIQELAKVVVQLGFSDFIDRGNLLFKDDIFYFIDTETASFINTYSWCKRALFVLLGGYLTMVRIGSEETMNWLEGEFEATDENLLGMVTVIDRDDLDEIHLNNEQIMTFEQNLPATYDYYDENSCLQHSLVSTQG